MRRAALFLIGVSLALPGPAAAARFAVGVGSGTSAAELAARVAAATGSPVEELAPFALVVETNSERRLRALSGVAYVERLDRRRRVAFTPADPLAPRQWYLDQIRAFDAWPQLPTLPGAGVRVAVLDSGVDAEHPDLSGRIALAKTFVGGSARKDALGHGTFVAGLIAAEVDNHEGIAGIAFSADLLVAKVVRGDGTISLEAEARAIRWAVFHHARVINLSFAGVRNPLNPKDDTYSPLEASAVKYAVRHGVLVVAAVGNGDEAPALPWRFAGYPAALPHVVGVSAMARDGSVPLFSNRDVLHNDLAAPGQGILSTLPLALTEQRPLCLDQGYSDCGPPEYKRAEGTSFAAPQVAAAAALLLSVHPKLRPEQLAWVLGRSALDATEETGCKRCSPARDSLTGWGTLNIEAAVEAVQGDLPAGDPFEPNDDAGAEAKTVVRSTRLIKATLDYWDDQTDVYRLRLREGARLSASVRGPSGTDTNLLLWKPGTQTVDARSLRTLAMLARRARPGGAVKQLGYRVRRSGWYYLQVKLSSPDAGAYTLRLSSR